MIQASNLTTTRLILLHTLLECCPTLVVRFFQQIGRDRGVFVFALSANPRHFKFKVFVLVVVVDQVDTTVSERPKSSRGRGASASRAAQRRSRIGGKKAVVEGEGRHRA